MSSIQRIGLGLAALGRPGYINLGHATDLPSGHDAQTMRQNAFAVLDFAKAAGIVYFDAARSYGRAEEFLGDWLRSRKIQPGQLTIASKWGYTYTANWQVQADHHEIKNHSLEVLKRQTQETTSHLENYLHLYQIHSATLESGVLDNSEVLAELGRLRDLGWMIGLSVTGTQQSTTIRKALATSVNGRPLFRSVQATWNLLERTAGDALAEAHSQGWQVVIKEALANGRLTSRNTDPTFADRRHLLEQVAHQKGCTLDALALAAVLAQSWATIVLSGATTIAQLASNLAAVEVQWDDECNQLHSLTQSPEEYWNTRSALPWN